MAALHSKYGKKTWRELLAPARNFSRDGFILTQNFADDLAAFAGPLFADPASRAVFSIGRGKPYPSGRRLRQIDLHTVLGQIAGRGAGDFYTGILATRLVEAVAAAGGTLDPIELRDYLPRWTKPLSVQVGSHILHTSPPPASAGIVATQMLQMAIAGREKSEGSEVGRGHLMAEAARRCIIRSFGLARDGFWPKRVRWRSANAAYAKKLMTGFSPDKPSSSKSSANKQKFVRELDASTSFVVADGSGLAVACTLTMHHAFGAGRMAPGLGFDPSSRSGRKGA